MVKPDLVDEAGFPDGFEVFTGFDPASAESTPETLSDVKTAVQFCFNAANGQVMSMNLMTIGDEVSVTLVLSWLKF